MSSEADWEIRTKGSPAEYFGRAQQHLTDGYAVVEQTGSALTLAKTLFGDNYTLQFTAKPFKDTTYIETRFKVIPD